jgi:hypothetical protein
MLCNIKIITAAFMWRCFRLASIPQNNAKAVSYKFHIHGSVHHDTVFKKMTKKMQLCRIIYYSLTDL